jgi:hypothetical protein
MIAGMKDTEFISIPEWARRVGISADPAYKAARTGNIPGCFAIGRLYRVNWPVFVSRAGAAGVGEEEASRLPR